jgi:hypothetical protein
MVKALTGKYNSVAKEDVAKSTSAAAVAQVASTVARPGPLTTEWWSVLVAGAASSILAAIGLPGSAAAQVAAIVAPVVLALVYAFVRTQTKGALADALAAIFPQADSPSSTDTQNKAG